MNDQAEERAIILMSDQPPTCGECGLRIELEAEPCRSDEDGPIYRGSCPVHGGRLYQDEPSPTIAFRAELEALGFVIEGGGAAPPFWLYSAKGGEVRITGADDGQDLPEPDNWLVGVYRGDWNDGNEPEQMWSADQTDGMPFLPVVGLARRAVDMLPAPAAD